MFIQYANFVGSYVAVSQCPAADKPEYAFIGRSNVGKSSLINYLTGHSGLARVSGAPGKTQTINHFLINNHWYLVDLPGYGYAKVSKTQRKTWEQFIRSYLLKRPNLSCVFTLIDSRIPPQKMDLEFINWMGEMQIPFVLVFTKADKRQHKKWEVNTELFKTKMLEAWTELPQNFITSAQDKTGKEPILTFIDQLNKQAAEVGF